MPFGNRRLLHCIPKGDEARAHGTKEGSQPAGEIPAWEACGKVVKKERQDFWEFVVRLPLLRSHQSRKSDV